MRKFYSDEHSGINESSEIGQTHLESLASLYLNPGPALLLWCRIVAVAAWVGGPPHPPYQIYDISYMHYLSIFYSIIQ